MKGIPTIPFRVVTTVRHGQGRRQETRHAKTMTGAMVICNQEWRKPLTIMVEMLVVLHEQSGKEVYDGRE